MNAPKTPDADAILQHTAGADTIEEYLLRQSESIRALSGHAESLVMIVCDRAATLYLRFEALQVLYWVFPCGLDTFLTGIAASSDEPAVAEAARALLFRNQIRRTVSASHPERLSTYLDRTRQEYAKWRFSHENRNAS